MHVLGDAGTLCDGGDEGGKVRRVVSLGTCGQFTHSAAGLNFQSQSGICSDNCGVN